MYCFECGMELPDQEVVCRICRTELKAGERFVPEKIYCDMTRIPFSRIIKNSVKTDGWEKTLLSLPFFVIFFLFRRITRTPWPIPMFSSRKIHFKKIQLDAVKNLDQKQFQTVFSFLSGQGYQHLLDYEVVGLVQDNLVRLMINPGDKTHALITVSGTRGVVRHVSFIGIWKNHYYSLTNGYGLPVDTAHNAQERYEGGFSLEKAYRSFLGEAAEIDGRCGPRIKVGLANLLRIFRRIHQFNIRQGLNQGVFISEKQPGRALATGAVGTSTCYHHPSIFAVRECTGCGHTLCESCTHVVNGRPYCEHCLPAAGTVAAPAIPTTGDGETVAYAGFVRRLAAFIVDLLLIWLVVNGTTLTGSYLMGAMGIDQKGPMVLLNLLIGGAFTIYYLILFFQKSGRTLGHRLFGLQVVDETGQTPDIRAAVVRFGCYLITFIFIFPLIGFLLVFFDKRKQGWHDRLAGTLVLGMPSWPRTIGAWVLILGLTGTAAWGLLHIGVGQYLAFRSGSKIPAQMQQAMAEYDPQLFVKPVWTHGPHDGFDGNLWGVGENSILMETKQGLAMLDLETGGTRWTNPEIGGDHELLGSDYDSGKPFPVLKRDEAFVPEALVAVDGETGRKLWQTSLPEKKETGEYGDTQALYDDQVLMIISETGLTCYGMADGTFLWKTFFDDGCSLMDVNLNQNVILDLDCGGSGKTRFLDSMGGNILWEITDYEPWTSIRLTRDYQLFYNDAMALYLVNLSEKRVVWKSDQPVGQIMQEQHYLEKLKTMPQSLALGNVVIDTSTGRVIYSLSGSHLSIGFSPHYGLFYNLKEMMTTQGRNTVFTVVDKAKGEKIGELSFPVMGLMKFAGEDDGHIYLFFDQAEFGTRVARTNLLVIFDKTAHSFEVRKIGKDYSMELFEYSPIFDKLFILGGKSIGLYELPAADQDATTTGSGKSE